MYDLIVTDRAQNEINSAIKHYKEIDEGLAQRLVEELKKTYYKIKANPWYQIRYKDIRAVMLRSFPYIIYYILDENENEIRILSCFHAKMNPDKRPE